MYVFLNYKYVLFYYTYIDVGILFLYMYTIIFYYKYVLLGT
jgi:hypothetical protein